MENSGLPSIQINLIFPLNDLFEDCETIDDTKPVFEKLKEVKHFKGFSGVQSNIDYQELFSLF